MDIAFFAPLYAIGMPILCALAVFLGFFVVLIVWAVIRVVIQKKDVD